MNDSETAKIGVMSDIHGDLVRFNKALSIFEREAVSQILCAGDVADRGPDADAIVQIMVERDIPCVRGNHDYTVSEEQLYWRAQPETSYLMSIGRIVSDATVRYLKRLPANAQFTIARVPILMAHAAPWDDMLRIFPNSSPWIFNNIVSTYGADNDVILLGHTHVPMHIRAAGMWILNPGSVYGETMRDSHTCATLTLPDGDFQLFDVDTGTHKVLKPIWL